MLDTLVKHAKYFTDATKEGEGAKYTKSIHFYDNGSLFMTDAIVAVLATGVHEEGEHTRTPANEKSKSELLPHDRMMRLIQEVYEVDASSVINCNIDVEELLAFAEGVNGASKCEITQSDSTAITPLHIYTDEVEGIVFSHKSIDWGATYRDRSEKLSTQKGAALNSHKLAIVLKLFKQLGYDDLKLLIRHTHKPVEIRSYDAKIRAIILPIRGTDK